MLNQRYILQLLLASICLIYIQIAIGEGPKIQYQTTLVLPEKMQQALDQYDPNFVIWDVEDYLPIAVDWYKFTTRQAMSKVVGDFNWDQKQDVVLKGHNDQNDLLISILSEDDDYRVLEIRRDPLSDPETERYDDDYGLWIYLVYTPKQTIKSPYESYELKLEGDAFEWVYFGKAAVLYYYKDEEFHTYQTGD